MLTLLNRNIMAWPFLCDFPDFTVRSLDDTAFGVERQCLIDGSELFGM